METATLQQILQQPQITQLLMLGTVSSVPSASSVPRASSFCLFYLLSSFSLSPLSPFPLISSLSLVSFGNREKLLPKETA